MFAYCNNNPVNYCDTNGCSLEAILLDGAIAGVVSLINAAVFGATGAELLKAFVDGFLQGVVCSATSGFGFGKVIKYAIILYDVGSAVYECWESGASPEECAIVALVQLWAAFSFDNVDTDQLFDLVFGLGTTLCASGITEAVQRKNSTSANTLQVSSQKSNGQTSSVPGNLGGKGGCGSAVVCCRN